MTNEQIAQAVSGALSVSVSDVNLLTEQGESNLVYRVETSQGFVLVRVPKSKKESHVEKLRWVEEALTKHAIPHARLLYATTSGDLFLNGFTVFEYLENVSRRDAIVSGAITLEEFHVELGQLLNKVHAIRLPAFGNIPLQPQASSPYFISYNSEQAKRILGKMEELAPKFPKGLADSVCKKLETLKPLTPKLKSVLCHTDPAPDNCIWNESMGVVLIDWDDARASSWVADLADLTYSGSHLTELGPREERRVRILESFLEGHGLGEFTYREVLQVEHVLHILKAVHHLPYYFEEQKNMEWFAKTEKRLLALLEE
jgi:Ser/Thr protein kinase RdoA (MazF antagonist)